MENDLTIVGEKRIEYTVLPNAVYIDFVCAQGNEGQLLLNVATYNVQGFELLFILIEAYFMALSYGPRHVVPCFKLKLLPNGH